MFFKNARVGLNEWWHYLIGTILIFTGWQTVASVPVLLLYGYIGLKGGRISMNPAASAASVGLSKNFTLMVLLSTFLLSCVVLFLVVKYLHRKPFLSVLTSRANFSWKRAVFGFFLWLLFAAVSFGITYSLDSEDYIFSFDVITFIPLLFISVILLPFQTSFEELFFRGYLTQGVGLVTGSRLLSLLLPGIAFGLLHSFNPEVFKYGFWIMMPYYIGMGIFLGLLAIMDNGIEIPLGVHFANNFTAAVFVSVEGAALSTDALFTVKKYNPADELVYSLVGMLLFILITAITYKWKDWGSLIRKIN